MFDLKLTHDVVETGVLTCLSALILGLLGCVFYWAGAELNPKRPWLGTTLLVARIVFFLGVAALVVILVGLGMTSLGVHMGDVR